jgi:hypothetical protein
MLAEHRPHLLLIDEKGTLIGRIKKNFRQKGVPFEIIKKFKCDLDLSFKSILIGSKIEQDIKAKSHFEILNDFLKNIEDVFMVGFLDLELLKEQPKSITTNHSPDKFKLEQSTLQLEIFSRFHNLLQYEIKFVNEFCNFMPEEKFQGCVVYNIFHFTQKKQTILDIIEPKFLSPIDDQPNCIPMYIDSGHSGTTLSQKETSDFDHQPEIDLTLFYYPKYFFFLFFY